MPDLLASPLVITLLSRSSPVPLTARKVWRPDLTPEIDQLNASLNIRAALHLLNDDFDACHSLTQTQRGDPYADASPLHRPPTRAGLLELKVRMMTHRGLTLNHIRWWIARLSHPHLTEIFALDTPDASLSQARKAAEKFIDAIQCAEASGDGVTELEHRQWAELTTLTKILIDKDPKREW